MVEYYARFGIIKEGYGLMGIQDMTFEAEDLEDLKKQIKDYLAHNETSEVDFMLDELEDENGNEYGNEFKIDLYKS